MSEVVLDQYLPSVWSSFKCPNSQLQVKDHILEARTLMWCTHVENISRIVPVPPPDCKALQKIQMGSVPCQYLSEFLSLMKEFATTTEQIKGWKYESITMVLKHSSLSIIFFSQLQIKIPTDLITMGLHYKSCHPHLPWAGQQQSNIGRAISSLWKAHSRTSK